MRARTIARWLLWLSALALVTVTLHDMRTAIQQVHVALVYLLLVLGATAYGGRTLGFVLACLGFLLLDYYFQVPFDRLSVGTSLDWLVLVSFLATAAVATHLLSRAQAATARAEQRAAEVAHLSRLGSELLSAGRATEALGAIAEAVRDVMRADRCTVFGVADADGALKELATRGGGPPVSAARAAERAEREEGTLYGRDAWTAAVEEVPSEARWERHEDGDGGASEVLVPLRVHGRLVGMLGLAAAAPSALDDAQRRFLDALTYYAALAVERAETVINAERREAEREADRMRNALLASVSHDLRTPLSTMKVLAQDTIAHGDAATAVQNAAAIEEQADRLARLVNNLLDITRLRGGALPLQPEVNAAEDLVGAVARQVTGVLGAHALERRIDATGPVLLGRFDFVHTMRILANLIENAVRYSPPGTPITLAARRDGDELVFEVGDRGSGVAPGDRPRIFEAFYRGQAAAPDTGGVGLGLHVARSLAEAQGGTLELAATGGDGSTFRLRLPAVDADEKDGSAEAEAS